MLFSGFIFSRKTGVEVFSLQKLDSLASFRQTIGFARFKSNLSCRGAY